MVFKKIKCFLLFLNFLFSIFFLISCNEMQKELSQNNNNNISKELIDELSQYLYNINIEFEIPAFTFSEKLNLVKNGNELSYIEFNSSDYYYVSAYSNIEHLDIEKTDYCCFEKYVWVLYEKEFEIKESYDNLEFIVCFQINKSSTMINLKNNSKVDFFIEHYQFYKPSFENGKNINSPINLKGYDIIIRAKDKKYYCKNSPFYELYSFPVVKIDNEKYFSIYKETININRDYLYNVDLVEQLGMYYDVVMNNVEIEEYSKEENNGNIDKFLILKINKISEILKNLGDINGND